MPSTDHTKNPERVAAGLKATMHNPRVSDEAKAHASERLQEIGGKDDQDHGVSNRSLGGYKATLHKENTSEEAKQHAREILSAAGYTEGDTVESGGGSSEHENRVIAGYKAALHNPQVSQAAKEHAKEFLTSRKIAF